MNARTAENLPATEHAHRSVLVAMADRYEMEPKAFEATLRATVVPANASREQFAAFLVVANEYKLNPLTKEIYAFPAKGGGIVPIVSIDGWANLINSHPAFDGMEFHDVLDSGGNVASITCEMHRKDRSRSISATEYMTECKRPTEPWTKWPRRMLRHKALIQAARYAFGFAGIIDNDEFDRFHGAQARDVTPARRPTRTVSQAFDEFSSADNSGQNAAIDHDPETGEVNDLDGGAPQEQEQPEVAKPAAMKPAVAEKPKADAKPKAAEKSAPAAKEKPPVEKPAEEREPLRSDATGDPVDDIPESEQITDKGAPAGEDIRDTGFDAGVDQDARDWPEGDVPVDVDQYEQYLDTMLAKAGDPRKLQNAFVNDGKLRSDCKVTQAEYSAMVLKVKARMAELEKNRK